MSGRFNRTAWAEGRISWTVDAIVAQLVSSNYHFDEASESISEIGNKVGNPIQLTNTRVNDGWCTCDYLVFRDVKDGPDAASIVFYRSDGLLIEWHDAIDAFPMRLPADDITVQISEPGIFRI